MRNAKCGSGTGQRSRDTSSDARSLFPLCLYHPTVAEIKGRGKVEIRESAGRAVSYTTPFPP